MINKILFYFKLILANEYSRYKVYEKYLNVEFGSGVRILHFPRFGSEPYLIKIGSNVTITRGVCFVNHDGGVGLFRKEYPGLNVYGRIEVGDNVFIGLNSIILKGVRIGNNVVIGAGSIINKDIPDNVVVAGVPAKIVGDIENYKQKALNNACYINTTNSLEKKRIIESYFI
jgi:acetyltransferase-like isoleucine patch superfamily enzyme